MNTIIGTSVFMLGCILAVQTTTVDGFTMDNVPVERNATTFCRVIEFSNGIEAIQCPLVTDEELINMTTPTPAQPAPEPETEPGILPDDTEDWFGICWNDTFPYKQTCDKARIGHAYNQLLDTSERFEQQADVEYCHDHFNNGVDMCHKK